MEMLIVSLNTFVQLFWVISSLYGILVLQHCCHYLLLLVCSEPFWNVLVEKREAVLYILM